jgi:hypothetical protein
LPDLQVHRPAVGKENGEKWTTAADLQPAIPKSDGLLEAMRVGGGQADRCPLWLPLTRPMA